MDTLYLLLHLATQVLALPFVVLVWATPANLVVAGLVSAPLGMIWSLAQGYTPRAVLGRAAHWIGAPALGGAILVVLGAQMGPWAGLEGWTIGLARGAAWGALACGLRLALLKP